MPTIASRAASSSTPAPACACGRTSAPASPSRTSRARTAPRRKRNRRTRSSSSSSGPCRARPPASHAVETAVHVQAMYFLNPSGPLRIVLSGGPTFVSVEQQLITEVVLTEAYPFDTAEFARADRENQEVDADVQRRRGRDVDAQSLDRRRRHRALLPVERRARRTGKPPRVGGCGRVLRWRRAAPVVLNLPTAECRLGNVDWDWGLRSED